MGVSRPHRSPYYIDLSALEMKERALKTKDGRVTAFPHRAVELFNLWDGIPWEKYPCWAKWLSPEGTFTGKRAPKTPAQYFREFFDDFGHDGPSLGFPARRRLRSDSRDSPPACQGPL